MVQLLKRVAKGLLVLFLVGDSDTDGFNFKKGVQIAMNIFDLQRGDTFKFPRGRITYELIKIRAYGKKVAWYMDINSGRGYQTEKPARVRYSSERMKY